MCVEAPVNAHKRSLSLNSLVRRLLKQSVTKASSHWIIETFQIMEKAKASSKGRRWKREELYRV